MTFRADDENRRGLQEAMSVLVGREIDPADRERSEAKLIEIVERFGPVVGGYPYWHPLVASQRDPRSPATTPGERCGYRGLDHTIFLRNGIITCPYGGIDEVFSSVAGIDVHEDTSITAEKIEVPLYHPNAVPILITCEWHRPMEADGTIPQGLAIGLLIEAEMKYWREGQFAETWETMRPYILGRPCGSRSSLFINQDTGRAIKKFWNTWIETGMFGPIKQR